MPCTPERIADLIAHLDEPADTDQPGEGWAQTLASWYRMLAALDPATAPDDHGLVNVVTQFLQPRVLDAETECAWLRYAYHATVRMYPADFEACADAATYYSTSLRDFARYDQALLVQRDAVAYLRQTENIDALLHARADYARLLHATGSCHDAAHEITAVWQQWLGDPTSDIEDGVTVLDHLVFILLGCGRITDVLHVLTSVPAALAARRTQCRDTDANLVGHVVAHAAACTYTTNGDPRDSPVMITAIPPPRSPVLPMWRPATG